MSRLIKFKISAPWGMQFDYFGTDNASAYKTIDASICNLILGDAQENYYALNRLKIYKTFTMERMTTRFWNFQCHRQVALNYVTGTIFDKAVGWTEDKITYTDPIIYFYHEKYVRAEPGACTASANEDDFLELCKKK